MATAASYPYTSGARGVTGTCSSFAPAGGKISGYTYAIPECTGQCTSADETTLANNIASIAPASICVDAEPWQVHSKFTSGFFYSIDIIGFIGIHGRCLDGIQL